MNGSIDRTYYFRNFGTSKNLTRPFQSFLFSLSCPYFKKLSSGQIYNYTILHPRIFFLHFIDLFIKKYLHAHNSVDTGLGAGEVAVKNIDKVLALKLPCMCVCMYNKLIHKMFPVMINTMEENKAG